MFYTTPDFGMSTSHLQECMHKNITDKWYLNGTSWLNNTLSLTWGALVVCTVLNCSTCCGCQSMVGKARCDTHWRVHVWLSRWGNSHYIGERGCLSLDWPLIQFLSWSNRTHARSGDPAAGCAELPLKPDSWNKTTWRCKGVSSSDPWPILAWEHRRATSCVSRVSNIHMSDSWCIDSR